MSEMWAVVKKSPEYGADLVKVPVPKPGSGEILAKVKATSICGTDVHIYEWNEWAQSRIKLPRIMGHEFAGEVLEVGKDVNELKVGDYISAETHVVCGKCYQCRIGMFHVCQNTKILGVDTDGAFAEYIVIPARNAWKNPADLPPEIASIQEPLGNAVDTVLAEGFEGVEGKNVAIIGDGPIGLLSVGVSNACGASKIYSIGHHDFRLNIAKKLGADVTINSKFEDAVKYVLDDTSGRGVDVVLEISGSSSGLQDAFKMVTHGGRISILGVYSKAVPLDITNGIVFKAIRVYGVTGRRIWNTWYIVSRLLSSGRLNVKPIITHKLKLSEFKNGMEAMEKRICGKVVLYP
ncbi:MAG: L-threonine 3-dehydrogenase [Candidatus Methanomethylicota archaeon]|nr:MAG: L-threonine 3-dehydrogenase [Candidatus Verstraetearchaeota archaeon]